MGATIIWIAMLLFTRTFASGSISAIYPAALVVLFTLGLWIYRARPGRAVPCLLLLLVWTEYRAFGINRRFNAITENAGRRHKFLNASRKSCIYLSIADFRPTSG